jgi:carbon storage regulator
MLVLSRKPNEVILIEGGIRIVVVSCDRGSVRLGIEAPESMAIVREEIAPPDHPVRGRPPRAA